MDAVKRSRRRTKELHLLASKANENKNGTEIIAKTFLGDIELEQPTTFVRDERSKYLIFKESKMEAARRIKAPPFGKATTKSIDLQLEFKKEMRGP